MRLLALSAFLVAGTFVSPLIAQAVTIPFFGPIVPNNCIAGFDMLLEVINRIIALLITLGILFVAPLMIAYSGFLFVVNPVNPSGKEKAKSVLLNTVVGIIIALAGWLIVNAIMAVLYNPDAAAGGGGRLGAWYGLISGSSQFCLDIVNNASSPNPTYYTPSSSFTSGVGGVSPRACTVPSTGSCSSSELSTSCFGSNAPAAGKVCAAESSNNPLNLSRGDITADGRPYSVGLFQINLTNSYSIQVDGQSCSNAFTQPCQNSGGYRNVQPNGSCSSSIKTGMCGSVTCTQLYNDCVTSAQNAANNISQACQLSNNGTTWKRWRNTATACGL